MGVDESQHLSAGAAARPALRAAVSCEEQDGGVWRRQKGPGVIAFVCLVLHL